MNHSASPLSARSNNHLPRNLEQINIVLFSCSEPFIIPLREIQNNSDFADKDLGCTGYLRGIVDSLLDDVNIEFNLMIYKDNFERSADCVQSEEDRMVPLAGILIVDSIISRLVHKSEVPGVILLCTPCPTPCSPDWPRGKT